MPDKLSYSRNLERTNILLDVVLVMSKKESAIDLSKFIDKGVHVKLSGGREVTGVLKGYDQLMNLVVDDTTEFLRDPEDPLKITDETRKLGLVVCRGPSVMLVSPTTGAEQINNPFHEEPRM